MLLTLILEIKFNSKFSQTMIRYNKFRKAFSKFYQRHYDLVSNFNVGIETLYKQGLSESERIFNCTTSGRTSDLMKAPVKKLSNKLVGARCPIFGRFPRGSTVGFLLLQLCCVSPAVEHFSYFILIYMFAVLMH